MSPDPYRRRRRQRRRRSTIAARQSYRPRGTLVNSFRPFGFFLVVVIGLAAVLGYLIFISAWFSVKHIEVQGAANEHVGAIEQAAREAAGGRIGALESESMALTKAATVAEEVEQQVADVSDATVEKKWPNKLKISVTERKAGLIWHSGAGKYLIDQKGIAFAETTRDDLPVVEDAANLPVTIGKPVVGGSFIATLLEIQGHLKGGGITVKSFRVTETTFEVQAVTDQGWYALFDTSRPIPSQAQGLVKAVAEVRPAQYADLRVPGRVYVR